MHYCKQIFLFKKELLPYFMGLLMMLALHHPASAQDVIIKKNGKVLHADVMKVGLEIIEYKMADYEEGPVYEIYRSEVYAIAYQNQRNDYFDLPQEANFFQPEGQAVAAEPEAKKPEKNLLSSTNLMQRLQGSLGIGYVGTYSKARQGIEDVSQSGSVPVIYLRAITDLKEKVQLGLQIGIGQYEFNRGGPNEYDELVNFSKIQESVFSFMAFGRYNLETGFVKPYGIFGLGFNRSRIDTELNLRFEQQQDIYQLNSSSSTFNFSVLVRAGVKVPLIDRLDLYSDIGTGVTLGQIGLEFSIM